MNDYSPRLYVIYAGRGDAMYIEWTDKTQKKHLVLLDGGPLYYEIGKPQTPYSKYLFAAGQRIWKTRFSTTAKFTPSAIINSHPHDDHLAGILAFLRFGFGKMTDDFDFKGYFYQPNCPGSSGLRDTRQQLKRIFEWAEEKGFLYEGIQVDWPNVDSILRWNANRSPDTKPPISAPYDPDKSKINKQSILMRTDPDKMEVSGKMYFTGDNVGYRIEEMLHKTPRVKLSIYKIQHHGSLKNTQIQDKANVIDCAVGYEALLRSWLQLATRPGGRDKGPLKLLEVIHAKLKGRTPKSIKDWKETIETRHLEYIEQCKAVKAGSPAMEEIDGLDPSPSALYEEVLEEIKSLKDSDSNYRSFWRGTGKAKKKTDWWGELTDHVAARKVYLEYMLVGQIRNFFSGFDADAYVISANYTHRHPAPATILGLALAIEQQIKAGARTRGGILYVTDGSAVDLGALQVLATNWGAKWPDVIRDVLAIRVLKNRCFMSLDASDGATALNRDVDGATEELALDNTMIVDLKRFRRDIEADASEPGKRDLGPIFCYMSTPSIASALHLTLQATGSPRLLESTPTLTPPKLLVEYWWITGGKAMSDGRDPYRLIVKQRVSNAWLSQDFWMEHIRTAKDKDTETLLYWKEGTTKKAFYRKTSDKTIDVKDHVASLTPDYPGYEVVYFTITLDVDKQPLISPSLTVPQGPRSFRAFCTSASINPISISSAWKAIEALTSSEIVKALNLDSGFEDTVLNYPVDLDKSMVDYEDDQVNIDVHSANVICKIPEKSTITIGSAPFLVRDVKFDLSWNEQDLIKTILLVQTKTEGLEISHRKEVPDAKHTSSLRKSLIGMGIASDELKTIRLPKLLGYLINSDSKMLSLLHKETPASLLLSGILRLCPDLDRSRARVTLLPGDMSLIHQVDIMCNLYTPIGGLGGEPIAEPFNPNIKFAGVDLVVQSLGLSISNATTADETITLTGTARFAAAKTESLTLNLKCVIEGRASRQPELELTLNGAQSLQKLAEQLPGTIDLSKTVPFKADGFSLSSLDTTQVGFAVTQPVVAHSDCVLSRVWAATNFDDWKAFLPSSFPKVQGDVRVQVYNPLDKEHLSVGVQITSKISLNTTPPCDLDVSFSANPLASSDSYEFRLWLSPSNGSLRVGDILEAVGVTDTATFKSADDVFPIHGGGDTAFLVHQISFALEQSTISGWKFGDWSLRVGICKLSILPDVLTLEDGTVEMELLDGAYHCSMQGDFVMEKINRIASASFKLPQKDAVGSLNIDIPDGISVSDMINALGLPSVLHSLPVLIKSILEVQLISAHFTIGYPATTSKDITILGCELGFNWDGGLDLGGIGLNSVKVDILYTSSESPLGSGKTEYGFTIAAILNKNAVMAQLSYDSTTKDLTLNIEALQTVLVTDILKTLLGDTITNALAPAIGTLSFRQGRLTLDTRSYIVKNFRLELGETESVKVNNLTMTALTIEYTAAQLRLTPASLLLVGQIRNKTAAARVSISCIARQDEPTMVKASLEPISKQEPLTLTGLLTLFGFSKPTFIQPEGCPEFFSLNVVEISASVEVRASTTTETSTLILRALDAVAVSTGSLSIFDAVKLQNIGLGVHYAKDKKGGQESITAEVVGDLIIKGLQGPVRVAYIQGLKEREFRGVYIKDPAAPPMSYEEIASQFLSPEKYAIPDHLGLSKISLDQIEARLVINNSLQVSGVGYMSWAHESNGVPLQLAGIGGGFSVKKTNQGSLLLPEGTEYDAYVTGKLTITDFTSETNVRAKLRIGSSHAPVLTAVLKKTTNDNKELVRLSQNMSSNKHMAWDRVTPDGTAAISFPTTNVYLYADLSKSMGKLFLCAHVEGLGDAILFARPEQVDEPKRTYFFSTTCTNITQMWNQTEKSVTSTFRLSQIGAQIIGYHGTVGGLKDELVLIKTAATAEDIKIEDSSSVLATMRKEQKLVPGGWFFATVQLQQPNPSPLVKALESSMTLNQGEVITLFANINKDDQTRTIYGMSVTNLYLLGGTMVVSGQGTYTPAAGANQPTISVDGQMKILSLSTEPLTIEVSLAVAPDETKFSLTSTGTPPGSFQKPFGTMFNVQIKLATIKGLIKHTEPKNAVYTLQGTGTIGTSSLQFSSLVIFDQDLKPTVVALQLLLGQQLTSSDVFTHIIQPGSETNPSWPEGYSVLGFKGAIVYYASKDIDAYKQGYHVKALVSFFGCDFTISAGIPLNQTHLTVDATYQGTIDLLFAKFDETTLSIITAKEPKDTVWEAKADLTLFKKKGFRISLKYKRGIDQYSATGSYQGSDTILGYSNPTVTMTYDNRSQTMSIDQWPTHQNMKDILSTTQFAEALKNASTKDMKCEDIVELVFKETIITEYTMKFQGVSFDDEHLKLNFKGTWEVKIVQPPVSVAEIPLPEISIVISKKLSLDQLKEAVVQMLVDNISSIALQLLRQPDKLALFFGSLVVKEYVQKTIIALICRQVNTSNVTERANELVNENETDVKSKSSNVNTEVDKGLSSTVLYIAGGAFVTAEAFLDGLIITFGLMSTLVVVYGAIDPNQAAKLQDKVAKAEQQKKEAEAKVAELKQHLVKGLSLDPEAPIAASFKDDETILLDWSKVPLKFQADKAALSWDITFSPTDDINNPYAIKMSTESTSRTFTTPPTRDFLGAPSIWTWVRAKATFGKNQSLVQGSWHPAETVTHMPATPPPKEVRLDRPPTINGAYITVSMPGAEPGDYRICIVTQDDLAASRPLYTSSAHIPTTVNFKREVRILELEACPPTTTGIRAVAKTLSSDTAKFRDSPYTSSQSLEALPPPLNLTAASMAGLTVMVTWDLHGQSQDDCELVVLNAVTVEPETTAMIQFQPTKEGQRLASVRGPTLQDGHYVFLSARQKSTKESTVGLYATIRFRVSNLPLWTIDVEKTYYDIPSNSLVLDVNSTSPPAGPLTFEVLLSGVTSVTPLVTRPSSQSAILTISNLRDPYPSTVQVRSIDASQTGGIYSDAWTFPSVPQYLPAPQMKVSYSAEILTLNWPTIPVANVRVLVWVQDSKTMKVLCKKVTPPSATSSTFSRQDFFIGPGMTLILTCSSTLENIHGSVTRVTYEITDMNKGWGTPHELVIPAPETKIVYSAVTTYSIPQPMESTLFWASHSAKIITALDWNTGNWLANSIPVPTMDLQGFCSITNTSRHSGHKEFFCIRQDGTIGGFLYLGSGGGWIPQTYAFATETANLNNGGVIDAVSLNSTTSFLCWVARDGAIRYSVWGSITKAWSVANYAAGPQAATITEPGFIRVTSQDGKGVHVFYLGHGGNLLGAFCDLVSDTGSMVWKEFTVNTDPYKRPRGSALCVSGVGTPIRIFWSSITGSVVEAHRDGEDLDSWVIQRLNSPESVGTSNMTVAYRDRGNVCLWWITPAGAIYRGDGTISAHDKISEWTFTKQLPDGTALTTAASSWPPAVTSNFYTISHSSIMSIFWVSPDQVLMGQTWRQEY